MQCFEYILTAIFAKQLDLQHNLSKSEAHTSKTSKIIRDENVKEFVIKNISTSIISKYNAQSNIGSNRQGIYSLITESNLNSSADDSDNELANNLHSYSTISVDTTMCKNCGGQIPTSKYLQHIEQCLVSKHARYEQQNDAYRQQQQQNDEHIRSMKMDDLLFSTPYKSQCHPQNPLESKIDEQSESDIEAVSILCPPDINDRRKVIAQLIKKKKRYELNTNNRGAIKASESLRSKELEMWHKVYTRLVPQSELSSSPSSVEHDEVMQKYMNINAKQHSNKRIVDDSDDDEDEEEDDDDDDDDDDYIPIAQNLKNQNQQKNENETDEKTEGTAMYYNFRIRTPTNPPNVSPKISSIAPLSLSHTKNDVKEDNLLTKKEKYKQDYDKMHDRIKKYYRRKRMRRMKKRQKMKYKVKEDGFDRYCAVIESDKATIERLYEILNKESNIHDRFAPFCSVPASTKASKQLLRDMMDCDIKTKHCGYLYDTPRKINESEEEKSMKMEVDDDENEDVMDKYEYFCHHRLDKHGLCPVHQNWRKEKYTELVNNLKKETEQLFGLNCILRKTNNMIVDDTERERLMQKESASALVSALKNNSMDLLNGLEHLSPCCSIKIDSAEIDIDFLLESAFNDEIE